MTRSAAEPSDLARLEERVLDLLDRGEAVDVAELLREFPGLEESDVQRVRSSAEILLAWFDDLAGRSSAGGGEDEPWLAPGERIGGYVVLRRIRGGGMGQVYQAVQESLYPREVALKVHRLGADAERELARARREAEVASRLVHPHLAAVHDMGSDEERGLVYFSMQYVDGPDLRAHLSGERAVPSLPSNAPLLARSGGGDARPSPPPAPPDRAEVRRLVTRISEVAGALAELHGRGYVHRDVKPENVLLRRNAGRDGRSEAAVLVDFGLVRAERALRGDGPLVAAAGTPGYVPPEAARGAAPTPAWDVYSLGVVLYEAVRGTPLPRDERSVPRSPSPSAIASLRADSPAVDPDLAAVVRRATAADPDTRYLDAAALQEDLERWLAGNPVSARRPPLTERLWRRARARPRRTAAGLVAVALFALCVHLATLLWHEADDVREGLADLERGNLATGWERLHEARPLILRALLADRPALARDLLDGERTDSATRVALAERERGLAAGLELAAAFLERDGYHLDGAHQHGELQAHLLRNLSWTAASEARSDALRTVARLFFERPAEDPATVPAVQPFRERLLGILRDPDASRDDRLHAASALGGCGIPEDLGALLDWAEGAVTDTEVVRLGLRSCERILRRARSIESMQVLRAMDWTILEERLAALFRDPMASALVDFDSDSGIIQSVSNLVTAWALLHRETSHRGDPWRELAARLPPNRALELHAASRPHAADVRERILRFVQDAPSFDSDHPHRVWWAKDLGAACAFVGREELRREIESHLNADPELVALFREGWSEGRFEVEHGRELVQRPDDDSRLRRLLEPEVPPSSLSFDHADALPGGSVATWSFESDRVRAGWARGADWGGGARWLDDDENSAHLRLVRSGSWLEASLVVEPRSPAPRSWDVVITHVAASRPYLPAQGQAWIRVEIDGTPVAERVRVGQHGRHELRLQVERNFLTPGEHVLRVSVVEASTTYWIHDLRLEAR